MIAAVVNAILVLAGSMIGLLFKSKIKERYSQTIVAGLALCVAVIGIINAAATQDILAVILCMVFGTVIGELIQIEERLDRLGERLKKRVMKKDGDGGRFTEGFVTAALLFCVGSMAIMGSLEAGINQKYTIIFSKSIIDCVTAITLAAAMGIGVAFSAAAVLIYQGALTLLATVVGPYLSSAVVVEMSAVGGAMLIGIALNMLEVGKNRIRVGNMLPAVILPIIYVPLAAYLSSLF